MEDGWALTPLPYSDREKRLIRRYRVIYESGREIIDILLERLYRNVLEGAEERDKKINEEKMMEYLKRG